MYNDIIKLLNLEQFNIKIKKIETSKINNILYCYITLEYTQKININNFCVEKRPSLEDRLFTFLTPSLVKGVNTPKKVIGHFFKTSNSVKGPFNNYLLFSWILNVSMCCS